MQRRFRQRRQTARLQLCAIAFIECTVTGSAIFLYIYSGKTEIRHLFSAAPKEAPTAYAGISPHPGFAPRQFMETKARTRELRPFAISNPAKPTSWWLRT